MTNEMTLKVRFVKCPKCRKLLPEPAGVPLYSCGGCGIILRAKPKVRDGEKKKPHDDASPDNRDSSDLSSDVAVPSSMEHSPNLQSEDDKDLSGSIYTISVESNTEDGHDESDRICSSTELSSPFREPNSDPIISTEVAAEICSSAVASCDNRELLPTPAMNSGEIIRHENSEFVAVESVEETGNDGSGEIFKTDNPCITGDRDSIIRTDSHADGNLKTSEESASAEDLESISVPGKISGVVSDDEIEDQYSNMYEIASKHVHEEATIAVSRESLSKGRFSAEKPKISSDHVRNYRTMSSKSISPASFMEKFESEGLSMARGGHPTRFRTRSDGDELSLHGWSPRVYSTGGEGPSSRIIRNPLYGSTSYPREKPDNFIPDDKEELMRKVIEIEDQLRIMSNVGENSMGSNFSSYQQFSHQFNNPYFHDPYGSASTHSSSLQPRAYSIRSWDCETKSDDQMYGFLGLKKSRERTHLPKRHFRPIAGGSPLLNCYSCSVLVQIPEDFLVSRRKGCHWLRCGACSVVLKFSTHNGTHIAPYLPEPNNQNSKGLPSDDDPRVTRSSAGKFKSGAEEGPGRNGSSALHQLMGYSSISQLLLS